MKENEEEENIHKMLKDNDNEVIYMNEMINYDLKLVYC